MKNVILIAVFLLTAWVGQAVYAQQGFGTNAPDKSAAVEIFSTKRGLLIPRVDLTATNAAGPITAPANSLLVYNKATAGTAPTNVTPGFYYWDTDHWVRIIGNEDVKTTEVVEGTNVKVDEDTTDPNKTVYTVGVAGHATLDKKVLVTKFVNGTDITDGTTTEWVDYSELINDFISAENGVTYDDATGKITLGGALTDPATIITTNGATNTLAIAGLEEVTTYDKVMVLGAGGVLQAADLSSLVQANNGLTINDGSDNGGADKGKVQLGGVLTKNTEIDVDGNTIAIKGLASANAASEIVVANNTTGVLQTVARSLSATLSNDMDLSSNPDTSIPGYSPYVQEINITTTLGNSNWMLTLPDAAEANKGQVFNVKILNTTDSHDGYLTIIDNTANPLTYGALPYQGWVLKSTGSAWLIVGRN